MNKSAKPIYRAVCVISAAASAFFVSMAVYDIIRMVSGISDISLRYLKLAVVSVIVFIAGAGSDPGYAQKTLGSFSLITGMIQLIIFIIQLDDLTHPPQSERFLELRDKKEMKAVLISSAIVFFTSIILFAYTRLKNKKYDQ